MASSEQVILEGEKALERLYDYYGKERFEHFFSMFFSNAETVEDVIQYAKECDFQLTKNDPYAILEFLNNNHIHILPRYKTSHVMLNV